MFSHSFVIAIASALYVQSIAASKCTRTYTVSEGDTCDSISAAHNASTYQLAVVNPAIDSGCSNLEIGQVLCLGTLGADCTKTYTVVAGDVCESVVGAYGIDLPLLYANNPILDVACDNLYIGEVVCVDNKYNVPSLAANRTKPVPPPYAVPALPYCDEI